MRTMKQLAKEALEIQNAVNLSGVIYRFYLALTDIREHLRAEGKESNDNIATHFVSVLYSSKIHSLTGDVGDHCGFQAAYSWALSLMNEEDHNKQVYRGN